MDEPSGSHLAILFSLATKGLKGRNGSIGEKNGENSELFVRIGQSGTREGLHVHRVSFTHTVLLVVWRSMKGGERGEGATKWRRTTLLT